MKKILVIGLVLVMGFSFIGCSTETSIDNGEELKKEPKEEPKEEKSDYKDVDNELLSATFEDQRGGIVFDVPEGRAIRQSFGRVWKQPRNLIVYYRFDDRLAIPEVDEFTTRNTLEHLEIHIVGATRESFVDTYPEEII